MPEMLVETPSDVVKFLEAQHDLIEDMFDEVLHASDTEAREAAFVALRQLLAVHETAEEMFIHPRARGEVGDQLVDLRLQEEHDAKELLSHIESLDIGSQEFIDELVKLRQAVLAHAEREEDSEFTQLRRELNRRRAAAPDQGGAGRRGYRADQAASRRRVRQAEFRGRTVRVAARPRP